MKTILGLKGSSKMQSFMDFDSDNYLTFVGIHINGTQISPCWKFIPGGGGVVGKVYIDGKLTGANIAYIYPDFKTILLGSFRDGQLVCTQQCQITKVKTEIG